MPWAVRFLHDGAERLTRFPHRGARLPVSTRGGAQILLMPWGRRPGESGTLPQGGWARLTHIQAGIWDRFAARPVRLPVEGFAERDVAGIERWFLVTAGQHIQGCLARDGQETRVYVVMLDCAPDMGEFERWPRIVSVPS